MDGRRLKMEACPPSSFSGAGAGGDFPATESFSPLAISIVAVLAIAFLLVSYYTIVFKNCGSLGSIWWRHGGQSPAVTAAAVERVGARRSPSPPIGGLDEFVIGKIALRRFRGGEDEIDGSGCCSVCLGEFQEGEDLRVLPKCGHGFHLHCIDPWLKFHSSCPLCRANVAFAAGVAAHQYPLSSSSPSPSPSPEADTAGRTELGRGEQAAGSITVNPEEEEEEEEEAHPLSSSPSPPLPEADTACWPELGREDQAAGSIMVDPEGEEEEQEEEEAHPLSSLPEAETAGRPEIGHGDEAEGSIRADPDGEDGGGGDGVSNKDPFRDSRAAAAAEEVEEDRSGDAEEEDNG